MVDAISKAVVQVVVGTPLSEAYQEIKHALLDFKSDVLSLRNTRTAIEAALLDADSLEEHSHAQRDTLEKLRLELERLTDFLVVREAKAMRKQVMCGSRFMKEARLFFSPSNQIVAQFLDSQKVKDIRNKLDAITRDYAQFGSIVTVPTANQTQIWSIRTATSQIMTHVVVGRDRDRDNIIRTIITDDSGEENTQVSSETLSVASIVGIGGMGKTELARYVFNNDRVKGSFDVHIWINVNEDFDVEEILKKIIANAIMNEKPFISETEYHESYQYHDFIRAISGKKLLLVLDNIWDESDLRLKWLYLRSLLKEGAYGSKVLITTRNQKVSRIMDCSNPYVLKDLTEADSWVLFQTIAITPSHEPGVEIIGKEIAKMCPNVPLVIRSIGSLLSGKPTVQEWVVFRDDQFANFSSYGRDILQTLKFSYDKLDPRLKLCAKYCTLIPKGRLFHKDEMIHRWIALGYVEPCYRNQSVEEAGEECMIFLLNTGFLKKIENFFGIFAYVAMHDVMYDLVSSLAGSKYKVADLYTVEFDRKAHHVSFDLVINSSSIWEVPSSFFKIKHLQSFIIADKFRGSDMKTQVKNWSSCYKLISKFQCLSVLDLSELGIKELPKSVGELMCLRFLNLSRTDVRKLPNSVTRLMNLQSLYLHDCKELEELPNDMSKLVKLRHLKLDSDKSKLTHMPLGLGALTDLRTLDMFLVSESVTKPVGKLTDLNNLNKLEGSLTIHVNRESKDAVSEVKAINLNTREKLEQLSIKFKYAAREDEMVLEALQPPSDLKILYVNGYGAERLPYWMRDGQLKSHLPNLIRIELAHCKSCRYICTLGSLLHLKHLMLIGFDNVEYIENSINVTHELPHTPLFPSLEFLLIVEMPKLKGWWRISSSDNVEEQHHLVDWKPAFPKLKLLHVSNIKLALTICRPPLIGFTFLQTLTITGLNAHHQRSESPVILSRAFPNLKFLSFQYCDKLKFLPGKVRHLSSVETLYIQGCKKLKAIPKWIDSLTSLSSLKLVRCPRLKSLPHQIKNLANLKKLRICECPTLEEKCQTITGEYWPYIQHIPDIHLT